MQQMQPQSYATSISTTERASRGTAVVLSGEHRLTTGESALLLGAFLTLAVSLASFMTL